MHDSIFGRFCFTIRNDININYRLMVNVMYINGKFVLYAINKATERKSQCCRQIERLEVQSYVMKVLSSICSVQPANTVNMPLRSS
jgi:hypothetical protein